VKRFLILIVLAVAAGLLPPQAVGHAATTDSASPSDIRSVDPSSLDAQWALGIVKRSSEYKRLKRHLESPLPASAVVGDGALALAFEADSFFNPESSSGTDNMVVFVVVDSALDSIWITSIDRAKGEKTITAYGSPDQQTTIELGSAPKPPYRSDQSSVCATSSGLALGAGGVSPLTICTYCCANWVYHPAHIDGTCYTICTLGCSAALLSLGWIGYLVCNASCPALCAVEAWNECTQWVACGCP